MAAVRDIYAHYVLHSLATFEETPPTIEEMLARRRASVDLGLPYLVAEAEATLLGFAYAAPFRPRAAYRYTAEDSVYVAPDAIGQGVGRAVLSAVIAACEALGLRQMCAVIGDSGNAASIGLHASQGFVKQGVFPAMGHKFGRWVDLVWMQRPLNGGGETPPDAPGMSLSGV